MAVLKCKMCGGDLNLVEGASTAECEFCGTVQTVPTADNEKKMTLFARANRLRAACEFDKAAGIYESIVAEFPEEAEAYWGLILCKYGIEYVDDPATGKKIPTCHRSSFDCVLDDSNFEMVMENADTMARRVYRDEAKAIEELRKSIVEVSSKEEPYDIFICYKETAEDGQRTLDSVLAQDIYDALTEKGYRVFFSRVTLEDKLGQEYEPYIFAALNSAKIMLAVGTDYEYYNAVWVKNEWSRFLQLIASGQKKYLIPCFKGLDAYDMPKEFAKLQAQDLGKVGAMQDLLRGIEKLLPKGKHMEQSVETTVVQQSFTTPGVASLLRRGQLYLEDQDWQSAKDYFDKVLDIDPECAVAYVGKLCAELNTTSKEKLVEHPVPFDDRKDYEKAVRFADSALREELRGYIDTIITRNKEECYQHALDLMKEAKTPSQFQAAAAMFEKNGAYRDADAQKEICHEKMREIIQMAKSELAEIEQSVDRLSHDKEDRNRQYSEQIGDAGRVIRDLQFQYARTPVFRTNKRQSLLQQSYDLEDKITLLKREQATTIGVIEAEISRLMVRESELNQLLSETKGTAVIDRRQLYIVCPKCGTKQRSNRNICFDCGIKFRSL